MTVQWPIAARKAFRNSRFTSSDACSSTGHRHDLLAVDDPGPSFAARRLEVRDPMQRELLEDLTGDSLDSFVARFVRQGCDRTSRCLLR